MTRKKHTHQTKSEAHAEQAVLATSENGETRTETEAAADEANGRLRRIVRGAEELAKKRLQGTRAELVFDTLPVRLEKALDALLDRVGLVRKSKLEGAPRTAPSAAEAQAA